MWSKDLIVVSVRLALPVSVLPLAPMENFPIPSEKPAARSSCAFLLRCCARAKGVYSFLRMQSAAELNDWNEQLTCMDVSILSCWMHTNPIFARIQPAAGQSGSFSVLPDILESLRDRQAPGRLQHAETVSISGVQRA